VALKQKPNTLQLLSKETLKNSMATSMFGWSLNKYSNFMEATVAIPNINVVIGMNIAK